MGGSSNEGNSSSRPLTGPERADIYNNAMGALATTAPGMVNSVTIPAQGDPFISFGGVKLPNPNYAPAKTGYSLNAPQYTAPEFVSAGAAKTLGNGDYDALQQSVLKGNIAGLDYAKEKDLKGVNQDLANRGIWSSGLADQAVKDREAAYAPEYAKAGADATSQRFSLQSADNAAVNAFNQQESAAKNSFNANSAQQTYNSKWAPLNYLQGLWNGTGGAISNSSSGGFGFQL